MASVMEGRRLKFTVAGEPRSGYKRYDVAAVTPRSSTLAPAHVALGQVRAVPVSNDDKVGRLRIPRQPITRWRARVPVSAAGGHGRELVERFDRTLELCSSGQDFRTRAEAADALVRWHDGGGS